MPYVAAFTLYLGVTSKTQKKALNNQKQVAMQLQLFTKAKKKRKKNCECHHELLRLQ